MKQAWACLFGGLMALFLLLATYYFYPHDAAKIGALRFPLPCRSFHCRCRCSASGLETIEEAKVIATYHVVGTVMEIF